MTQRKINKRIIIFASYFMALSVLFVGSTATAETVNGNSCERRFLGIFWCLDRNDDQPAPQPTYDRPRSSREYDGSQYQRRQRDRQQTATAQPRRRGSRGGRFAPIMGPFTKAFNQCASGCSYTDWGIWGDRRHQVRRSCHNSGSAIDIHALKCNGRTYKAGSSKFRNFVSCMHGREGLYTIHGNKAHRQHVDIALRSCQIGGQGKIRVR
jgi:hypothetical protein